MISILISLKPIIPLMDYIQLEVAESLGRLYDEGIQHDGKTHRFFLSEIRGDWKFQKDSLWEIGLDGWLW